MPQVAYRQLTATTQRQILPPPAPLAQAILSQPGHAEQDADTKQLSCFCRERQFGVTLGLLAGRVQFENLSSRRRPPKLPYWRCAVPGLRKTRASRSGCSLRRKPTVQQEPIPGLIGKETENNKEKTKRRIHIQKIPRKEVRHHLSLVTGGMYSTFPFQKRTKTFTLLVPLFHWRHRLVPLLHWLGPLFLSRPLGELRRDAGRGELLHSRRKAGHATVRF